MSTKTITAVQRMVWSRVRRLNKTKSSTQTFYFSSSIQDKFKGLPKPPAFSSVEEERLYVKQRLAGSFRIFARLGYDEGVAGHITVRDPEFKDTFWLNGFGIHFSQITASNLIRVDHAGNVVEGSYPVNTAAFNIHSRIHMLRPDVNAAVHTHSVHGRAFSTLGKELGIITQDACAFYKDHVLYDDFGGVVTEADEGLRIATALGSNKAAILQNHGLLTVGESVDAAVWWYIAMNRCCEVQLLAEAAACHGSSQVKEISPSVAAATAKIVGAPFSGWFQFQPLYARVLKEEPDFLF